MNGKKGKFQSLTDAADMLRNAFAKQPSSSTPVASKSKNASPSPKPDTNSFAGIEKAMRAKAEAKSRSRPKGHSSQGRGKPKNRTKQKAGKGSSTKTILKFPGAKAFLRQLVEDEQRAKDGDAKVAAQPTSASYAARHETLRQIRDIVSSASLAIEERPTEVSTKTADRVTSAIVRGACHFAARPEPDLDNGYIVGFDFGTSSLKLAVRQPYVAGENIAFMPVPEELRSGNHSHLWQTALWFDPENQSFSLIPQIGMKVLDGFKTGIIGGHGGQRVRQDIPVTRTEAAIAYVALQSAYFIGWYADAHPLAAGGDHFLSINIGIPVAAHDDSNAYTTFKHIVCAARNLVASAERLTLADVREAHQTSGTDLPPGWQLIPELTAAIAGYTSDPKSLDGAHVLIDVGASTLDIVAFNHVRRERNAVISAGVELLGSAALQVARSGGIVDEDFRRCCERQFHSVFGDACRPSRGGPGFSPALRARDVQLITTGGGCASALHSSFIEAMNCPKFLGSLATVRPEPLLPSVGGISDPSRLLLAYGLTRDIPELLELKLPSQVPDIAPRHDSSIEYISKDAV